MEVLKELKKKDRLQAAKVGHLRLCVCAQEPAYVRSHVCGCSVRIPACFSTFWLSGALRSQAGEWRGHIRGSFRAPTHPPGLHDPPPPYCTSHHPHFFFPRYPPSSLLLLLPVFPSWWRGESATWGEGAQVGKVPLRLTAGRSGFCRHGRRRKDTCAHACRHVKVCASKMGEEGKHIFKFSCGHKGCECTSFYT